MNYLFTICGRTGSKGLKNKNIGMFNEIPLVYYTLAAMKLASKDLGCSGHNVDFALNTDSDRLIKLVKGNLELPFTIIQRPEELAGDKVAKVTVIRHSLVYMQEHTGITYDYVIDLDITAPLRTKTDVLAAIKKKQENSSSDVVYSLVPARKNPYFNMAKYVDRYYEKVIHANFISRQETPEVFDMNASIYVYEPRALMSKEPSGFFNTNADAIIMRDTGILDIDCKDDLDMMETLAKYYFFVKYPEYREIYETATEMFNETNANSDEQ